MLSLSTITNLTLTVGRFGRNQAQPGTRAGRAAAASKADALFFFGPEMEDAFRAATESGFAGSAAWTDDAGKLAAELAAYLRDGDFVLMKGSRGMRMERFGEAIIKQNGGLRAC